MSFDEIIGLIKSIPFDEIIGLLKSINEESITFFYYACSISTAIMALTTIIFTYYNERIIQRARNISLEFQEEEANLSDEKMIHNINSMISLLSNNKTYKATKIIFFSVSFASSLLWGLILVHYILNTRNFFVIFLLSFSSLIVVVSLLSIPIILIQFNKNNLFKVKSFESIEIDDLIHFLNRFRITDVNYAFSNLVNPKIKLQLESQHSLFLYLYQKISLRKLNYIIEMVDSDKKITFLNLYTGNGENKKWKINSQKKKVNSYKGLYNDLKSYKFYKLHIYKRKKYIATFNLNLEVNNNILEFNIDSYKKQNDDIDVKYLKKNNLLTLKSEDKKYFLR
ncbi:hypothetical protein [Lysinibacillus fusiformis]